VDITREAALTAEEWWGGCD